MPEVPGPPSQQENPWLPPSPDPLVFDTFDGLNTNASRPGIGDKDQFWCDGWCPVDTSSLRTYPGVGTPIYTQPGGKTVVWYDFANLGATPIMVVLLSDGSLVQVNTITHVTKAISGAGTVSAPSQVGIAISQWGGQFVIIVANQANGYWIWDGSIFYAAGGIGPPVAVVAGGAGFTSTPSITATGGSGSGISLVPVISTSVVLSVSIVAPGTGYKAGEHVTLTVGGGGGTGASVSAVLMPFGIQGTCVETYTSRVWVGNGPTIQFTAPGLPVDFATSDGGGSFTSTDSFLRNRFVQLRQSNGFLYMVADSSMNYISGVQTTGLPPTTTFTNQNADPEIGTPYPDTVDVLSRNIIWANDFGIHISFGGAVSKISEKLDRIYNSVPNSFGGFQPSACKAIIFGKRMWCLLIPVIDPITKIQVNKLFVWDGEKKRWSSTQQDITLIYVQHQEINSVITSYGTDGNSIYPLFQTPSTGFVKTVQSKLWDNGTYLIKKTAVRLGGIVNFISNSGASLNVTIDNESSSSQAYTFTLPQGVVSWVNNVGASVTWQNNLSQTVTWINGNAGIFVLPVIAVAQQGSLLGMTISTSAADAELVSMTLVPELWEYRG